MVKHRVPLNQKLDWKLEIVRRRDQKLEGPDLRDRYLELPEWNDEDVIKTTHDCVDVTNSL